MIILTIAVTVKSWLKWKYGFFTVQETLLHLKTLGVRHYIKRGQKWQQQGTTPELTGSCHPVCQRQWINVKWWTIVGCGRTTWESVLHRCTIVQTLQQCLVNQQTKKRGESILQDIIFVFFKDPCMGSLNFIYLDTCNSYNQAFNLTKTSLI